MTLAQMLAAAQDALFRLQTGAMVVEVEFDGRQVRYARADVYKLMAYIATLEAQIAGQNRTGAIGVLFT